MNTTELKLKTVPLADLKPSPYNPRKMTPAALDGLTKSLDTFGLVEPIVVNVRSGQVVGGHQRLEALKRLGIERTQVVQVDLDEAQERALNLTLNNDALMGTFTEGTAELLAAIKEQFPADLYGQLQFGEIYFPGKTLEFVPGADIDYGLRDDDGFVPAGGGPTSGGNSDSSIYTMRLILTADQRAELGEMVRALGKVYGVDNPTDVIYRAVRDAYNDHRTQAE